MVETKTVIPKIGKTMVKSNYWISRGHLGHYILKKVEIWSGVANASWTYRLGKIELLSRGGVGGVAMKYRGKLSASELHLLPI